MLLVQAAFVLKIINNNNNSSNKLLIIDKPNHIKPIIKIQKNNSKNKSNNKKSIIKTSSPRGITSHTKSSNDLIQYALAVYLDNNNNNKNNNNNNNKNIFHHKYTNTNSNIIINNNNKRSRNLNSKDFTNMITNGFYTKSVSHLTDYFNKGKYCNLFKNNSKSKSKSKGKLIKN